MRLYDYRAAVHGFFYLQQRWGAMLLDGYFDISFITPRVLILHGRQNLMKPVLLAKYIRASRKKVNGPACQIVSINRLVPSNFRSRSI